MGKKRNKPVTSTKMSQPKFLKKDYDSGKPVDKTEVPESSEYESDSQAEPEEIKKNEVKSSW